MRVTIKQLKSLISEAVRTAQVPSVKNHKSELARLKKIIKEGVEDAVSGVDPITKEAAALSPQQAEKKLEELLRDAPLELIEKLKDLISDPEFKEKKAALNEGNTAGFAMAAGSAGLSLAWLSSMIAQYGLNDPSSGLSPQAIATLAGLLVAATGGSIMGAIHSAMENKQKR